MLKTKIDPVGEGTGGKDQPGGVGPRIAGNSLEFKFFSFSLSKSGVFFPTVRYVYRVSTVVRI